MARTSSCRFWVAAVPVLAVCAFILSPASAQVLTDKELYDTGVLALSKGFVDVALRSFEMVVQRYPASTYAAAACATQIGVLLGHVQANLLLRDVLKTGASKAPHERQADFAGAIAALNEEQASLASRLAASYRAFTAAYDDELVTLRIVFLDISRNLDAVRDDLEKLERGFWIPWLLLTGLIDQVQLMQTFADLLSITGETFSSRSLAEWLGSDPVERLLSKRHFYFHLGEIFAAVGDRELAIDALQRVVRLTQFEPASDLRAEAIARLGAMGEKPLAGDSAGRTGSQTTGPRSPLPGRISILFDETRLVARPTGEKNCSISELAWYGCSDLAALLRGGGYDVASLRSSPIIYQDLAAHNVLAILTTDHNYPYSFIEVLAIALFVEQGGGLLVCESTWQGRAKRDYTVGALARFFGADFIGNGMIRDVAEQSGEGVVAISDLISHPVTEGVSGFLLVEAAVIDVPGPATVVAYSSATSWFDDATLPGRGVKEAREPAGPLPVLATMEFGKGRIVFLADGMMFTNGWLSKADARRLALNIFTWLSGRR